MLKRIALGMLAFAAPFGALVLVATDWFPAVAFALPASMMGLAVLLLALQADLDDASAAAVIRPRPAVPFGRSRERREMVYSSEQTDAFRGMTR